MYEYSVRRIGCDHFSNASLTQNFVTTQKVNSLGEFRFDQKLLNLKMSKLII